VHQEEQLQEVLQLQGLRQLERGRYMELVLVGVLGLVLKVFAKLFRMISVQVVYLELGVQELQ
jgi:hypothetical protein